MAAVFNFHQFGIGNTFGVSIPDAYGKLAAKL